MQKNQKVDQTFKKRVEKLSEVDGWVWDGLHRLKGNCITVNEYSMIDGKLIQQFVSVQQICNTYPDCTSNHSQLGYLVNSTISGKMKGTVVPKVVTHVSGRIFQKQAMYHHQWNIN